MRRSSTHGAHIVKSRARHGELNDLETSVRPLTNRQTGWKNELGEAKGSIAGLVEAFDKRDVERGGIVSAECEVDIGKSPRMRRLKGERTAIQWPLSSIVVRNGLVYPATWKNGSLSAYTSLESDYAIRTWSLPLRRVRVSPPVWISEVAEVRRSSFA